MQEMVKVLFYFPLIALSTNVLIAGQYFDALWYFGALAAKYMDVSA